jgi:trimeric autotransporter adhesin
MFMKAKVYSILLVALISSGLFAAGCESFNGTDGTKGPAGPEGPSGLPCPIGQKCIDGAWIKDGTVVNASLAPGSISTGDLLDGSITTAKLADHAVTDAKVMSIDPIKIDPAFLHELDWRVFDSLSELGSRGNLNTDHGYALYDREHNDLRYVLKGGITSSDLGPDSVDTINIRNLAVTTPKIANGAITTDKIGIGEVAYANLRQASGSEAVDTGAIRNGAVTDAKIAPGIDGAKLANGTVGTNQLTDGGVGAVDLAPNSVTTAKIAAGAVTAAQLQDQDTVVGTPGAVSNDKLQQDAVTTEKIKDNTILSVDLSSTAGSEAVANSNIRNLAVNNAKINDVAAGKITGTITNAQIANGAITDIKVNDVAAGKITGQIGTTQIANLAVTNAQINDVAASKITGTLAGSQIGNAEITNANLAADAVQSGNILNGTIVSADLSSTILNEAVATANIQAGAVTNAKLGSDIDASKITAGTLNNARFSSYSDLSDEGFLDNSAPGDILLQSDGDVRYAAIAHTHDAATLTGTLAGSQVGTGISATNITTGTLGDGMFSAYSDLSAELYLNNDNANDILIRSQSDARYAATSHTHSGADITSGTVSGAYIGAGINGANLTNYTVTAAKIGHNEIIDGTSVRGSTADITQAKNGVSTVESLAITSRGGLHLITYNGTFIAASLTATDKALFDVVITIDAGTEVMRRSMRYNSLINGGFSDQVEVQWMGVLAAGAHTITVKLDVPNSSDVSVTCLGYATPPNTNIPLRGLLTDIEFNNE